MLLWCNPDATLDMKLHPRLSPLLISLAVLLLALVVQQLLLFQSQLDELVVAKEEQGRLIQQVDMAVERKAEIEAQLTKAEQRHQRLGRQLPAQLGIEPFERQLQALAESHRIKILASKAATYSRPHYSEAKIDITLEGDKRSTTKFIRELRDAPRFTDIEVPEKHGKKSIHLAISVYAVERPNIAELSHPACLELPTGVWYPPFRSQLESIYANYLQRCQYVREHDSYYRQLQRIKRLEEEALRLDVIVNKLHQNAQ